MNKKILIVVAHPDDEVLGVGGTAIKHVRNGDDVYCLILGKGVEARLDKKEIAENVGIDNEKKRNISSFNSGKIIGFKEMFFLDFPDNRFDSVDLIDITKEIELFVDKIQPDIIYTHYENDLNIDHRKTFEAVITACRPCNDNCPKEIYCFEVLSSTEWQLKGKKFMPNVYVDISKEIDKKIQAIEEYKEELREWPHSRSIEGVKTLAKFRGLESGKKYAEGFYLVRCLID